MKQPLTQIKLEIMKKLLQKTEFKVQFIMLLLSLFFGFSIKAQYNYLGTYNNLGKPDYLEPISDVVTQNFLDDVDASLPESKPVPTYNPQYISNGTETDICLKDSADVWVTFVTEGAGYRNVLGFYSYDLNSPPLTVNDISNETIIFPNVSAKNSGGDLVAGDKVKIGSFPAGTGIGWFLVANGWNGNAVGNGNWKVYSNPDFNPESNPVERFHNVLLNDTTEQRIVLGFEDIRRDYPSCDQDFNDAIFYVSANPYSAIQTDSLNTITQSEDQVGSGGNGGLESNGNLAAKIAKRNFKRKIQKSTDYNDFDKLPILDVQSIHSGLIKSSTKDKSVGANLHELLPTNSLFNTQALVTTPADLLNITNAKEVFSVDYVNNAQRKGVAMAMFTENEVYEHTKAVCDRLNGAELMEISKLLINNHEFILFKLLQDDGKTEYAINFVVQEDSNGSFTVDNHWALGDYNTSSKNYNFQLWSSTVSMTVQLVQDVLFKIESRGKVSYLNQTVDLPSVYVKKGFYSKGKLHLEIVNTNGADQIDLTGSLSRTETGIREVWQKNVILNGEVRENVVLDVGMLFDIDFNLNANNAVADVLYTADGAWGTDLEQDGANLSNFQIEEKPLPIDPYCLPVERGVKAEGTVRNYVSFFKYLKAGGKTVDINAFNALKIKASISQEVEITVVKESIREWKDQFRTKVTLAENQLIFFDDLRNSTNDLFDGSDIQSVVISIIGDGKTNRSFTVDIDQLAFVNADKPASLANNEMLLFPNPVSNECVLRFRTNQETNARLSIIDASGKLLFQNSLQISKGNNTIPLPVNQLESGVYICRLQANENTYHQRLIKH